MKIAIGSKNPAKVSSVENVIRNYWPNAELIPVDVETGVSVMPMSDEETIAGAQNRAMRAYQSIGADIGIGLEGGAMQTPYGMFLTNWVVAVGSDGVIGYGASTRMQLPESIANELRAGAELGPVMDRITNTTKSNHKNGAIGFFTHDVVKRQDAFEHAVAYALVKFVNKDLY